MAFVSKRFKHHYTNINIYLVKLIPKDKKKKRNKYLRHKIPLSNSDSDIQISSSRNSLHFSFPSFYVDIPFSFSFLFFTFQKPISLVACIPITTSMGLQSISWWRCIGRQPCIEQKRSFNIVLLLNEAM